jgi:hypothetical protein
MRIWNPDKKTQEAAKLLLTILQPMKSDQNCIYEFLIQLKFFNKY